MTVITLKRGPKSVPLTLPADPEKVEDAFARLYPVGVRDRAKIVNAASPVETLNRYLRNREVNGIADVNNLNQLAKRVDAMSERDQKLFDGMLDASCVNGLADILKLTERISDFTILPGASSDATLGKYMVEHGFLNCPESIKPYLDFDAIGAYFYSETSGAYTADGYVVRKEELPEFLQKRSEPEPWRNEDREEIIRLNLDMHGQEYLLALPSDDEYLDQVCEYLGICGFAEAKIKSAAFTVPYLADLLPPDAISVEGANEMAEYVEDMLSEDGALLKFCAVLEAEAPADFPAALALVQNLDDYEVVQVDAEEYGKTVLCRFGADEELISSIDGYMDLAAFGNAMMEKGGVQKTQFGLIRRLRKPFPAQDQGMQML